MTDQHPLSDHARGVLAEIASAPKPTLEINAGVVHRLYAERLVDYVELKSTYKSHAGREITHLKITEAGRAKLGLPPETKAKKGRNK